jgi:formylglycine-generating enzyme required for sulfatase activity
MNKNLLKVVKDIVEKYGETVLSEPQRFSSALADLAREEPKRQRNTFVKCLEHGFVPILKSVSDSERGNCKQRLAQKLHEEEGFDLGLCEETVKLLAAVLSSNVTKKVLTDSHRHEPPSPPAPTKQSFQQMPASRPNMLIDNVVGIEMVLCIGGTFPMGDIDGHGNDSEKPVHYVTLNDFYIGKYPVTQKQWIQIMGNNRNHSKFKGNNLPVENVSWLDAQKFIVKLNSLTGKKYRLPTEAEWEYEACGGASSRDCIYAGSNDIDDVAWYEDNSGRKTQPVGTKKPNELGIYDMSGNVWEWVNDWYEMEYYKNSTDTNPTGPTGGSYRAIRGGSWCGNAEHCRVSTRYLDSPSSRTDTLGFRLALSP